MSALYEPRHSRPSSRRFRQVAGARGVPVPELLALVLALAAPAPHAQQWEFQPTLNVQASYEDNITLDPDDPESGLGSSWRAAALARRSTEARSLELYAGLSANEFVENSDLNNVTGLLGADWSYQMPRSQFQLSQSLTTQSTLTSEAATTGITDVNRQQYRFTIQPAWSYLLDPYSTLTLGGSYDDVFYEDVDDTGLTNYRSGSVSLNLGRRLSERLAVGLVASYGQFRPQGEDGDTENHSIQLSVDYQVSETFNVAALAGGRWTSAESIDATGRSTTEDTSGATYSLSAQKQFADGAALSALAARELSASGASEVLDTTRLQLGYSLPVTDRLSLGIASSAYRNRQLGEEASGSSRDYADAELGLSYKLRQSLSLVFDYSHRWQRSDDDSSSARSNRFGLSLAWRGL